MLDLSGLNEPQYKAVTTTDGPVLVLAGAGSGKTRALTFRIAYILDAGLAGPLNILALTFTNKAAGEMKERAMDVIRENQQDTRIYSIPWMGTFHSICVKILKQHGKKVGLDSNFTIYDSGDQTIAMKEAMRIKNISTKEFNPRAVKNYISTAKNELVDEEAYLSYASGYFQQVVAELYPAYQKVLRDNNAVDFDDLLLLTVKLFKENPEVLEEYQDQFHYILVDEYQDTNHAQYVMVTMLAQKNKNLCVVGDDDQSIYAFRGATIKNILSFEKDYPESTVIKLEQNYRSTKTILEASYQVISQNESRKDKKLWTENAEGENIIVYTAKNELEEAKYVVDTIESMQDEFEYQDMAILYRTNAQSRNLEEAFLQAGIPYKIVGGIRFYERKEIKDIVAYLRVLFNSKDTTSLERIINVPKKGIGSKTFQNLVSLANEHGLSAVEYILQQQENLSNANLQKFGKILKDLTLHLQQQVLSEFIEYLLDRTGYIKMLQDGTIENEARIENIKELLTVASKFDEVDGVEGLELFLDEVSLLEDFEKQQDDQFDPNRVTLMTIHASKGLEFNVVFVVGAEENLFPHSNSIVDQKDLEEERRLAYVAITRAKKKLYLTHADQRTYFGAVQNNPLSRFIMDIDESLVERKVSDEIFSLDSNFEEIEDAWKPQIDLKEGDEVKHEYFGKGTILLLDDDIVEIDFGPVHGVKELMLEYAKLVKV